MTASYSTTTYAFFVITLMGLMGLGIYYDRSQSTTTTPTTPLTTAPITEDVILSVTPINLPPIPDTYEYALMTNAGTKILSFSVNPDGTVLATPATTLPSNIEPLKLTIIDTDGVPRATLLQGTLEKGLHLTVNLTITSDTLILTSPNESSTPRGIWFTHTDNSPSIMMPPAPDGSVYEASLAYGATTIPFARFTNHTNDMLDIFFKRGATTSAPGEDFLSIDTEMYPELASLAETGDLRIGEPFILIDLVFPNILRIPIAQLQLTATTPLNTSLPLISVFHAPALYIKN